MKSFFLSALLLAVTPVLALADATTDSIKQEAEKCTKALLASDLETVAKYSHPRVLEGMGGKEAMIATIKKGMETMKAQGISLESATIGEPEKPKKVDALLLSFVPQKVVVKTKDSKIEQESTLLGVSEDEGKKWVFIDLGSLSKEQFAQAFPALAGKIELPAKKPPVITKEEKG